MLDIEEVAAYEAWKEHKLTSSVDLSVSAFNLESEAVAVAYELGVAALYKRCKASKSVASGEDVAAVVRANPYRQKGMTGYIAQTVKKVTS